MLVFLSKPVAHAMLKAALAVLPMAPAAPPLVPVESILEDPSLFLGKTVRTYVQVHSEEAHWDSYLTRYTPDRFRCLRIWSDEQLLWNREDYEAPLTRLFLPRHGLRALSRAQAQDRFLCTVTVNDWFGGQPWIEVQRAILTRRHVPEGALLSAIRALELEGRGAFALAVGEYERALSAPLPEHIAERLGRAREACSRRDAATRGRPMEAQVQRQPSSKVRRRKR